MNRTNLRDNKGITLIILVVTIIILMILAGISIVALTDDEGIMKQAEHAKGKAETSNEREILEMAVINAVGKSKFGEVEEALLKNEIEKLTKAENVSVSTVGENVVVEFGKSQNRYSITKDGEITLQ